MDYHTKISSRLTSNKIFSEWILKGLRTETNLDDPLDDQWIIIPQGL